MNVTHCVTQHSDTLTHDLALHNISFIRCVTSGKQNPFLQLRGNGKGKLKTFRLE